MNTPIFCERKGKDFNNITKRCLKKCNAGEKRSKKTFKCKKLKKTKRICEDNPGHTWNPFSKRCLTPCKDGYYRNEDYICKKTKKNQLLCDTENKDFNPFSKRCVKKCAENQERDLNFKCIKIKIPAPATENPSINKKDATELIKFITILEEKGSNYQLTGIHYTPNNILETLLYEYLVEKYNTNCFLYGFTKEYWLNSLFISINQFGLFGNQEDLLKLQKYIYKMIILILNCIQKIQNTHQEVIIIPVTFSYQSGNNIYNHANILIYRKSLKVLEHYEPHGKKFNLPASNYHSDIVNIMKIIVNKMNTLNKDYNYKYFKGKIKYIPSNNICIYNKGLQLIENELFVSQNIQEIETGGLCAVWSIFFAEMTLMNPYLTSREILDNIFNFFDNEDCITKKQIVKNIIRGYLDIIYNKINPIVQDILGVEINENTENIISKRITSQITNKLFIKNYTKHIKTKFKKYNKINMKQYFEEPEKDDVFRELTPEKVNSKYYSCMFD